MANDEENSTDEGEGAEYFELCQLKQITPSDLDVRNLSAETALLADRWRLAAKAEADPATRERLMQMSQLLRATRNAFENDQAWLRKQALKAAYFLKQKNAARSRVGEVEGLLGAVLHTLKEWKKTGKPVNGELADELAAVIVHRLATVFSLLRSEQKVIPGWKLGVPNLPQKEAVNGVSNAIAKVLVPDSPPDAKEIIRAAMRALGMHSRKAHDLFDAPRQQKKRKPPQKGGHP